MITLLDVFILLSFIEPVLISGAAGGLRAGWSGLFAGLLVGLLLGVGGAAGMSAYTRWLRRYPAPPPQHRDLAWRLYDSTLFFAALAWIAGICLLGYLFVARLVPVIKT